MSATTPEKKAPLSLAYYVHSLVCLCIMFGFGLLDPVEPLTPLGMRLVGVFLGVLYGWVFIEIVWPSLAGLLAMMLVGGMKPVTLLNNSFGHPIVQMMFFIFVFCATINHYGLSRFISLWFITRKFVAGRPWMFSFTFLASIFILGALTSASPAALISWSILYGVCEVCGYKKGDSYPTMMVFGIVFAAQIGQSMIPFKQVALTVFSAYETMSGMGIDYAKYMLIACLICLLCALFFIVLGKYIFRPDMSKLLNLEADKLDTDGSLNLTGVQKTVLLFLFLLVLLLLAPNFLPADFFLTRFLKAIGNTGIVILLVTVMAAIKVEGKPLLNFKVMVDSGVTWGIVLLLAFVQPLTIAMAAPERHHGLSHAAADAFLRRELFHHVCPVHRLRRRGPDLGHEQRRRGRGAHAGHPQLLPGLRYGAGAAAHHGGHGRPLRFPDACRQCQCGPAARQRMVQYQGHLEVLAPRHPGRLRGHGHRDPAAGQPAVFLGIPPGGTTRMLASTGAALLEGRSRKGDDRQPGITANQPSKKAPSAHKTQAELFDGENRDSGQEQGLVPGLEGTCRKAGSGPAQGEDLVPAAGQDFGQGGDEAAHRCGRIGPAMGGQQAGQTCGGQGGRGGGQTGAQQTGDEAGHDVPGTADALHGRDRGAVHYGVEAAFVDDMVGLALDDQIGRAVAVLLCPGQQHGDVLFLGQQEAARIEGVGRFFIRQEGQFAHVRGEEFVGIGIAAHLGHIHEARIGHHQGRVLQFPDSQQQAVVPVHVGEEVVEGQAARGQCGQGFFQPGIELAAAGTGAGIPGQQQGRGRAAKGRAGLQGRGCQGRGAPFHGHGTAVRQVQARFRKAGATRGGAFRHQQGKIRVGDGSGYDPHASCLRISSKAFCRL